MSNFLNIPVQRIHFEPHWRDGPEDEQWWFSPSELTDHEIAFAYVDGPAFEAKDVLGYLGNRLHLENPPYDPRPVTGTDGWWRFEDDLLTLSQQVQGLIIIVDNAASLFADRTSWVFDLIEVFVASMPHWARQGRLAHLFFVMQRNDRLKAVYSPT